MANSFNYNPLQNRHIRLLRLHHQPSNVDDHGHREKSLNCEIFETEFPPKRSYRALSYVWGPPGDGKYSMVCNGITMNITENLHAVLTQLSTMKVSDIMFNDKDTSVKDAKRQLDSPRVDDVTRDLSEIQIHEKDAADKEHENDLVLWVDQLCIDQSNIPERSQQVNMMSEIYSNAIGVIIWLGVVPESDVGRFKISNESRNWAEIARDFIAMLQFRLDIPFIKDTTEELIEDGLPGPNSLEWQSLNMMLEQPYFSRVWVLQEVFLSPWKVVLWGHVQMDWAHVQETIGWALESKALHRFKTDPLNIRLLQQGKAFGLAPTNLFDMVRIMAQRNATDDRDRVYSLLDIVDPPVKDLSLPGEPWNTIPGLRADYAKSIQEVFYDLTEFFVTHERSLRVLYPVWHRSELRSASEWPSFVYDPRMSGGPLCYGGESSGFSASKDAPLAVRFAHENGKFSMRALGMIQSRILYLSPPEINHTPDYFRRCQEQLWDAAKSVNFENIFRYPEESRIKAFLQTFFCGRKDTTSSPNDREDQNGQNDILLSFAAYLAAIHIRLMKWQDDTATYPATCLRAQLDLAIVAVIEHEGLSEYAETPDERLAAFEALIDEHGRANVSGYENDQSYLPSPLQFSQLQDSCRRGLAAAHPNSTEIDLGTTLKIMTALATLPHKTSVEQMHEKYVTGASQRRFFITETGHMAMGPLAMRDGDFVAILYGSEVPLVLRQRGDAYALVGECYVHGIMYGEAVQDIRDKGRFEARSGAFVLE